MKNNYKVGVNFDTGLLDKIIEINKNYKDSDSKVSELYGSIRMHSQLAARPDYRLPNITMKQTIEYIKKAKENGIAFNYTLNSIIPYGSKYIMNKNLKYIISLVDILHNAGVYRFTISNPIMLEIFKHNIPYDLNIEVSTISHVDTITQIKYYHEVYGVNKICCNLLKNRDFKWLEKAAKYCNKNGIILELMINEFCGVGSEEFSTHCIYRDSCYICHATNYNQKDADAIYGYPMEQCTASRNKAPENWLRVNWIRPEDIKYYNEIGINNFKITGRTGSTNYIVKTINSYMKQKYDGNLLELWKPLESIKDEKKEDFSVVNIPSSKLNGFIEHWSKNKFVCAEEVCGETCTYCKDYYNKYIKGV